MEVKGDYSNGQAPVTNIKVGLRYFGHFESEPMDDKFILISLSLSLYAYLYLSVFQIQREKQGNTMVTINVFS